MNRAAAIVAMLWESWRLTRLEAAQRLVLGLVAGAGAIMLFGPKGPTGAFWIMVVIHSMIWFSIAKLNGGRFADGYKPGFPMRLWFSKPVPTATFVAVAMLYDAISCTALYLVSALLLGLVSGHSFPLSSMVLCLVSYHFAYACCQWSTRSRAVQWIGSMAFSIPMFLMVFYNVEPPLKVEFSRLENSVFVAIGVVSFVLTVSGVARQRRGDSLASAIQPKALSGGFPNWLIGAMRIPCPTTSATRAQVWFELRSSGLPVLAVGLAVAAMIYLLHALGVVFAPARDLAFALVMLSIPLTVFSLGSNAFGLRRKQSHRYGSAFELTQPYVTERVASLKVLVRTVCVLVALTAIATSMWAATPLLNAWGEYLPFGSGQDSLPALLGLRQKIADVAAGTPWYAWVAAAVATSIAVAAQITWQAALEALGERHRRLVLFLQSTPVAWGIAAMLLAVASRQGIAPVWQVHWFFMVTLGMFGVALLFAAVQLVRRGLAAHALTIRYAIGAVVVSASFGAALPVVVSGMNLVGVLLPVALVLVLALVAPWAFDRVRHA